MNRPFIVLIGMIVIFCVTTVIGIFLWLSPPTLYPEASDGVLDAAQWDFGEDGVIPLRGEWEFYEGVLLTPEDFRSDDGNIKALRRLVQVPGGWRGMLSSGDRHGYGAGTYRLLINIDAADVYGLRAKKIRLSSRIYFDGEELGGRGLPALSAEDYIPNNFPFLGAVNLESGPAELIIQVASYKYIAGGLVQAPEFGLLEHVTDRRDTSRLADMIVVTALLIFGLYYAGMYRQWRKEPYLMHFSLFCITIGLFFSLDNEILAMVLFPHLPFQWLQKLLFLLPTLSFFFFTHYVYRYLGEKDNLVLIWLRRCAYVYFILTALVPNHYLIIFLFLGIVMQIIAFATIFYAVFRSQRRGDRGGYSMMLGVFFLIISWGYGQLRYKFALDVPYYMIVTPLLLVFSQAFLMSNRLQNAFNKSEQLTNQLLIYDRQKDEFLAKTSHELRTPLHGIMNLSQSLLDNKVVPLHSEHRENVRLLHLMGRRLAGLVHDILDMNQIRHGQLSIHLMPVNLGTSVRFVIETLSIGPINKEVKLVNELPPTLPLVLADENRLRQILHNLIENGLKYTKRGTVRISASRNGDELAVSVTDTGEGIPAGAMAHLFQPFTQFREEMDGARTGLGLGLSISKQLVELQGGRLEVESEVGVGSRFTFTLPVVKQAEEATAAAEIEESAMASFSGLTQGEQGAEFLILIVDDEPSNLKILIDAISSMKYTFSAVGSGEEALEALERSPKPDLVLLDLMMPGISGLDVCKSIRTLQGLAELPVLMLTASGQTGDIIASFAAGANDILQKPFELAELKARVQSLLAMKSSSEQAIRRELDFLQAQITPHFLYNSLNALLGLSYKDVEKLRETIYHLTTYLRAKFTFAFLGELIDLERELELVKAYVAIEQLRFDDRLKVEYHIEEGIHCMLPPLTLQPIVENAVRHGIGPKLTGGTVNIIVRHSGDNVDLLVEDDGVGMDEETLDALVSGKARKSSGVGVGNVNRRLQMLYGHKLEINSKLGQGTQVKLRIPAAKQV